MRSNTTDVAGLRNTSFFSNKLIIILTPSLDDPAEASLTNINYLNTVQNRDTCLGGAQALHYESKHGVEWIPTNNAR